ncbi:MAG: glycoside hydrolase 100 family protein, partial [Polyangiaceae bacterium]
CISPDGWLASTEARTNYRRVWARDGCICGLAALTTEDPELIDATRVTLRTLGGHQAPTGAIPSNVGDTVSYGGTAGRVDATMWYLLCACLFDRVVEQAPHDGWWANVDACDRVLRAWEHNEGGLVYVPMAGDWADEYAISGYLLYDQLLRLWAARELERACVRHDREIADRRRPREIEARIVERFERTAEGGLLAGFHAGARHEMFDAFGHALLVLLDVGDEALRRGALERADAITRHELVPAFWPPIEPPDPRHHALELAAAEHLRNRAGRYHNGGLWPMITGFWAAAARHRGDAALADRWARGVRAANTSHGDPEYLDAYTGEPGGTRGQAWSIAAEVIAQGLDAVLD